MAKKKKKTEETRDVSRESNEDEKKGKTTLTTLELGTPVWVKDEARAWVAAEISKVDATTGDVVECAYARDEDDELGLTNAQPVAAAASSPWKMRKKTSRCANGTRKRTW